MILVGAPDYARTRGYPWVIGKSRRNGFWIRRIVFGRKLARAEKRADEQIRRAIIYARKRNG